MLRDTFFKERKFPYLKWPWRKMSPTENVPLKQNFVAIKIFSGYFMLMDIFCV